MCPTGTRQHPKNMQRVAVVYFSQEGATAKLADSVCEGIESVAGVQSAKVRIEGRHIVDGRYTDDESLNLIDACDVIVFGSPTYMGGPAAQFKAFADASSDRWEQQRWSSKLAAGFTCGSNPNGDQLATLQYFSILAAQHGMLWVNLDVLGSDDSGRNTLGTQLGVSALAREPGVVSDLPTANYLGVRVAKLIAQLGMHNS